MPMDPATAPDYRKVNAAKPDTIKVLDWFTKSEPLLDLLHNRCLSSGVPLPLGHS